MDILLKNVLYLYYNYILCSELKGYIKYFGWLFLMKKIFNYFLPNIEQCNTHKLVKNSIS